LSIRLTWRKITEPDSLAFILLAAFLLRLAIIPLFYDDYNYWAFGVFTNFLLHGQNPYHVVSQDPTLLNINPWRYPPFYLLFTIPALLIQQLTGQSIAYLAMLKIPLAISDIVSSYFLYRILLRSFSRSYSLKFCALFAFNPLVIFESSGGGFNDPIPIAFTVSSLYFLLKHQSSRVSESRNLSISAMLLGLGIASKIYPLLIIPLFLRQLEGTRSRILYALAAMLPLIGFSIPFLLWDWTSYVQLLTVRNVGGQHPLFPAFQLGSLAGALIFSILAAVLVIIYSSRISLSSGLTVLFLWVNLAIFSASFNYMVWGIPFFIWFVAEHRRLFLLPVSPVFTFIIALIFQGSYNLVGGSAGFFYWTYHILHIPLVLSLQLPWLGDLGFLGLSLSEIVAGYYLVAVLLRRGRFSNTRFRFRLGSWRVIPRKSKVFPLILLGLVFISWGLVGSVGTFLPHRYPVIEGNLFSFSDSFRSSLLDYQWVFSGQGTYVITPSQSMIETSSPLNGTGEVYRGWGAVANGFQSSRSALITMQFRFDGLAEAATRMTLINMTDGELAAQTQNGVEFVYVDRVNGGTILLLTADNHWHNFTMRYSEGVRTLKIDNSSWTLSGGTFDRLVLGNSNSQQGYGGAAAFSDVRVYVSDFPTGYQSVLVAYISILIPSALVALFLASAAIRPRQRGLGDEREGFHK